MDTQCPVVRMYVHSGSSMCVSCLSSSTCMFMGLPFLTLRKLVCYAHIAKLHVHNCTSVSVHVHEHVHVDDNFYPLILQLCR